MSRVLVLGATGRVGHRVSARLQASGLDVVLAARDGLRLEHVAAELGVAADARHVLDVQDTEAVTAAVRDVAVVVNTAGPFMLLAGPVVDACLRAGVSYVDPGNEQPAVHSLLARDGAAREAGITLVTGAGLGLTSTECLTLQMRAQMPVMRSVRSVLLTWNSQPSVGVKASAAAAMQVGSTRYVAGELVHAPIGADRWTLELLGRERTLVAAPLGDVEAVHRASGAADVAAFVEAPPGAGLDDDRPRSVALVEVVDDDGDVHTASVQPGDSLTATTHILTQTVLGVLEQRRPGAWTPGALLGVETFRPALQL